MATASLSISVTEKRMLNEAEAASYCGLLAKHFKAICTVQPVLLGGRERRFDKRDLDQWIDHEKAGGAELTRESILARLE